MSEITMGYGWASNRWIASRVDATASTSYPSSSSTVTMVLRTDASSSTIKNFCIMRFGGVFRRRRNLCVGRGQYYSKTRSLSRFAGDIHAPVVMGDNLFDDGESDSGSHFSGRLGPLGAVELLEDVFQLVRVHPHALIAHGKPQFPALQIGAHVNFRLRRRILHGIRQQVVKGVFHQLTVAG